MNYEPGNCFDNTVKAMAQFVPEYGLKLKLVHGYVTENRVLTFPRQRVPHAWLELETETHGAVCFDTENLGGVWVAKDDYYEQTGARDEELLKYTMADIYSKGFLELPAPWEMENIAILEK